MNDSMSKRRWIIVALILATAGTGLVLINIAPVTADNSGTKSEVVTTAEANPGDLGSSLSSTVLPSMGKMISALIIVLVCIYLGLMLLKRLMGRGPGRSQGGDLLEVIETTYLAPKKSVALVRVADKSVLIGVTDNQISILTELDAVQTAEILVRPENRAPVADRFGPMFQTAMDKIKGLRSGAVKTAIEV